nr:protein BIG GRAIN 1-like A [Tanacetum cinerariifolium]
MNSRRFPSFSSSLLDEIYKSFDERRFEDDHKVARRSTAEIESRHEREREISRSCHVNYSNSSYSSCSLNEDDTITTKNRETEARLDRKSKSANASTCSSASSFSRSCLSNTPSSKGKSSNGIKRTVRFYADEDNTRLKSVKNVKNSINEEIKGGLSEDNRRISEAARNLLKNYRKKVECEFDSIMSKEYGDMSYDYMSDSSSDLFELDNLKYREELPVYETTHLDTNRAIANGLVMKSQI